MAVEFKDYYRTLGVPRTATDDEIRKAFRKLARQYHPDVAKNKSGAEEKFKEINEAYEVLGDATKRKRYDQLGPNWKQGTEFRPPPGWSNQPGGRRPSEPDFEFQGTGFSDFFEQIFGRRNGGGFRSHGFPEEDIDQPGGDVEADLLVTLEEAVKGSIRTVSLRRTVVCKECQGSGQVSGKACPTCRGSGRVEKTDTHKVKIPIGILEGQSLRIRGQGEPGSGKGAPGDLFLRIRFAKHPDFRVDGADLFYDLDLAPWEAALGANIAVPTLDGRVNIKIPAGTSGAQKLRVRGRGLKSKSAAGDLIVVTRIVIPQNLTPPEQTLWETIARESKFKPRD